MVNGYSEQWQRQSGRHVQRKGHNAACYRSARPEIRIRIRQRYRKHITLKHSTYLQKKNFPVIFAENYVKEARQAGLGLSYS
jgi:hypothetical protein